MHIRSLAVAALLLGAASCTRSNPGPPIDGSSETAECDGEGCACEVDEDCDAGLVCASQTCTPGGGGSSDSSGDGSSTGSSSTSGSSTSDVDDTSSSDGSSGWASSTGSTDESSTGSTGPAAYCGDGEVNAKGEECDDGNVAGGDGCDAECKLELWQHEGVAHDVPVTDLYGWTQCWSDDYSGTAERLVSSLAESCDKAQLLVACLPVGGDTLTIAAHAAREDVLFPVDYSEGERHSANGVAWYWSPDDDHVGFGPAGNTTPCIEMGEDEQLCWRTTGGGFEDTFTFGRRCGPQLGFTLEDAPTWQRVVFHADAM